jgi:RsiW-degrading membrane proteinase PrsW (M82 family)
VAALLLSLAPVVAFLLGLHALDTYRLLTFRRVLIAVLYGGAAALACYAVNTWGFSLWGTGYAQVGAPVFEELAKAAFVILCVARNRVGFPVDAAVVGFAVGSGFSLVENLVYLRQLSADVSPLVWLVRGVGTALMHGGATAILGVTAVALWVRWRWWAAVPAFAAGMGVHILYNSGLLPALERTAVILVTLPPLLMLVFWQSERMLARWLHAKLDDDLRTLDMIESGAFLDSTPGVYLASLRDSFQPEVVADLFCLLRLSAELSAKAKGELMQREMGFEPAADDPERGELLAEMARLERGIGKAGRRALAQLLPPNARDQWERVRMQQG